MADRIRKLRQAAGLSQAEFGKQFGVTRESVSQWEKGGGVDPANLKKVAATYEVTLDWLAGNSAAAEAPAPGNGAPANTAPSPEPFMSGKRDLPIRGRAKGGEDAHYIEETGPVVKTFRPHLLEGVHDAYAVEVWDESMHPVLRHGWMLWVHPGKPVRLGDAVVIQLNDGQALVKELVKRTEKEWIFHQYKPEKDIKIARDLVKAVHLVVGNSRGML